MKSILFLFLFLFSIKNVSQEIQLIKESSIPLDSKIHIIDSLLIFKHIDSLQIIKSQYASWLFKNNKIKESIKILKSQIKLLNSTDTLNLKKSLFRLGYYESKRYNYLKSNDYYLQSLSFAKSVKSIAKVYYQLGKNFKALNDYIKAIEIFKYIISLSKQNRIPNKLLINTYINISNLFFSLKDRINLKRSFDYAKKADSLVDESVNLKTVYVIKQLLAYSYNELESLNIDKSIEYYNAAINIAYKLKDTVKANKILLSIGNLYNTTDYEKSLYYLNKVKPKPNDSTLISDLAFNYALTYDFAKNYKKSIRQYKKAVSYKIGLNFSLTKNNDSILLKTKYKERLLHILPFYALSYYNYYKDIRNKEYLVKSLFYYKLSDKLIDLIRINSSEFKSRLFWREKSEKVYSKAIEVSYLSNEIADAFYFMEKNKALLLLEDTTKEQYKLTLDIPKKLLAKEINFKKQIIKLKNSNTDLKQIVDTERKLSIFQDSIYQGKLINKTEAPILSIKQIQKTLKRTEIIVEFHFTKEGLYTIFIGKDSSIFIKNNKIERLKDNLQELNKSIKKPFAALEDFTRFKELSSVVFNQLFPNIEIVRFIKDKKITFVNDGVLSFIPLEVLINNDNHYLVEDHKIGYAYSVSFLTKNKQLNRAPTKELIAFAPLKFDYDNLSTLNYSQQEIKEIKSNFKSDIQIDSNATEAQFISLSKYYNIVHIASHANASTLEKPWIAFKDKKIMLNELYPLKLQADLVVLSACNTTVGEIAKGEGVLSLARGFFSAGSKTIVSSLWNVNDKATTIIMSNFYKNLKNGQTKSTALQQAKINYINSHSLTEASPYYWASFILIGDSGELHQLPNDNYWYYVFFGTLLLFVIVIIRRLWRTLLK